MDSYPAHSCRGGVCVELLAEHTFYLRAGSHCDIRHGSAAGDIEASLSNSGSVKQADPAHTNSVGDFCLPLNNWQSDHTAHNTHL